MRLPLIAIASLASLGLLSGCGTKNIDICHTACEWAFRCANASESQTANCNNDCDNKKGTFQDKDDEQDRECSNGGDIREKTLHCYELECNLVTQLQCLGDVPTCIKK